MVARLCCARIFVNTLSINIGDTLRAVTRQARPQERPPPMTLRAAIGREIAAFSEDQSFPVKPQKIVWDVRQMLAPGDIV